MKSVLFTIIAGLFTGTTVFGQCEPDLENCKDTDEPGQICPMFLPQATVNAYYDEVITVIPPGEVTFGTSTVLINYITVDSITNLPEGISYAANAERFYADSAYCFQIFGIPVEVGSDTLSIYVTPYIFVGTSTIPGPQAVNDTSVVMTVAESSGINPGQFSDFHLLPNKPNPFPDITTIGFFTPFDALIQLQVYNILGTLVYEEKQGFPPGEYIFNFNGRSLPPGTYFYRVTSNEEYRTGKLIKTKK
jgi:hypothetical protein